VSATEPTDWGVFVNECGIFAQQGGADWWAQFYIDRPGLITELILSPAGGHHHVAAPSKEDAEFMCEYMISKGIHKSYVKVQRLLAAQSYADKRKAAREASLAWILAQPPAPPAAEIEEL
jgi:hypothetical protein